MVLHLPAGLGVAVGGRALHVGRPLDGALVESGVDGGNGCLALAAAAHGGGRVEGNGLGLRRGRQQERGEEEKEFHDDGGKEDGNSKKPAASIETAGLVMLAARSYKGLVRPGFRLRLRRFGLGFRRLVFATRRGAGRGSAHVVGTAHRARRRAHGAAGARATCGTHGSAGARAHRTAGAGARGRAHSGGSPGRGAAGGACTCCGATSAHARGGAAGAHARSGGLGERGAAQTKGQ